MVFNNTKSTLVKELLGLRVVAPVTLAKEEERFVKWMYE